MICPADLLTPQPTQQIKARRKSQPFALPARCLPLPLCPRLRLLPPLTRWPLTILRSQITRAKLHVTSATLEPHMAPLPTGVVNEAGVEDEGTPPSSVSLTTRPSARSRVSSGLKPRPVRRLAFPLLLD